MKGVRYVYEDEGVKRRIPIHEINYGFPIEAANAVRARDRRRWVKVYGRISVQHRNWRRLWRAVRAGTPLGWHHYTKPRKPRTVHIPHPLPGHRKRRQRYRVHSDQAYPELVMLGAPIRRRSQGRTTGRKFISPHETLHSAVYAAVKSGTPAVEILEETRPHGPRNVEFETFDLWGDGQEPTKKETQP